MQRLRQRLELLFVAEQESVCFWRVPEQGCAQCRYLGRTAPSPVWEDRLIRSRISGEGLKFRFLVELRIPLRCMGSQGTPQGIQPALADP